MTALISARDVHKGFGRGSQRVDVLKGVDFDAHPGEFVAIVGSSGAGKSTLLYCLCGLVAADSGQISLAGNDLGSAGRSRLARIRRDHVGFIFQDLNLISSLNVRDNVALPARLTGMKPRRRDIMDALETVGLTSCAGKYPNQLSGGQRQRVAIARSLVRKPQVLFADEPTGSLDVTVRDTVLELLQHTVTPSTSLVMVTHDLDIAATADRVIVLAHGRHDQELTHPSSAEIFAALHRPGEHM
ncbi:ABC transporter ATP-binding protein [Cutibacterium sp. V947]|uniref:ABC transporter ATP-binding protein n=1 Tax=unclassified Cutibacterium TaxID=2649671 RepID=UPI003EDF43AF